MERGLMDISKEEVAISLEGDNKFIDNFKSVYYLLNASPDTEIKVFNEDKIIKIPDIYDLNNRVQEKLKTHSIIANKIEICLTFTNRKAMKFNNWVEFERKNWDISYSTESCSIQWDFYMKLPQYEFPQRHTLKVRMGSTIKPNEFFQLMIQSDDDFELMDITANVVCKVNFINSIICNELINIVSEWYETLEKNYESNKVIKFLRKKIEVIVEFVHVLFLITGTIILYKITRQILKNIQVNDIISKTTLEYIYLWCLTSGIIMYIFNLIGKKIGNKIKNKYSKISDLSNFKFTKLDNNKDKEINNKNKKIIKEITLNIVASFICTVLSLGLDIIIKLAKWIFNI